MYSFKKCAISLLLAVLIISCLNTSVYAADTDNGTDLDITDSAPIQTINHYRQLTEAELNLNTDALIEVILDSAYMVDLTCGSTTRSLYNNLRIYFNGFQELESRSDAASLMLAKLASDENNGSGSLDAMYLRLLLSEPVYANMLSDDEAQLLIEEIAEAQVSTVDSADDVIIVNDFYYDKADISASTTDGGIVPLYIARSDFSSEDRTNALQSVLSNHSAITVVDQPTSVYNCHSYAWYNQSASNDKFVNDITEYLNDSHTTEHTTPAEGYIAIYYDGYNNPVHSAVVSHITSDGVVVCISKWGANGLFMHNASDVPSGYTFNGSIPFIRYFTYRRNHTYSIEYGTTATTHTFKCANCTRTTTGTHSFTKLSRTNGATHTYKCANCSRTETEMHTLNAAGIKCTVCGYTGPFAIVRSIDIEK